MRKSRFHEGFTLIEVMIMVGILSVIMVISTQYLFSSWRVQSIAFTEAKVKTNTEQGLNRISRYLAQSYKIMNRDSSGSSFVQRLNMTQAPRPIDASQLPLIRKSGSLSPEKNCELSPSEYFLPNSIGNSLMFLQVIGQENLLASEGFLRPQIVDVLRINYIYITDNASVSGFLNREQRMMHFGNKQHPAQNLILWRGVPMVEYRSLQNYYDKLTSDGLSSEKSKVAAYLISKGITRAWDKEASVANQAIYEIRSNGAFSKLDNGTYRIEMDGFEDVLRLDNRSSETTYSIAYNTHSEDSHPGYFPFKRIQVPRFYNPTLPDGVNCPEVTPVPTSSPNLSYAFPRGFEVGITGPQSGRSVLLNVSVVSKDYAQKMTAQSHSLSTYARDL